MKEKVCIYKYEEIDSNLETIINLHREIFWGTNLYGHLIYFDGNFQHYFSSLVESKKDIVFALKKEEIIGFIHFKLNGCELFLNNISIGKKHQGKGLGKLFLKESLILASTDKTIFSLDVFRSNVRAFHWYKQLGLQQKKESYWVKINNKKKANPGKGVVFSKDKNGFLGFFKNGEKIATAINEKTLLVHNLNELENIPTKGHFVISNQSELINSLDLDYEEIDVSFRMSGSLHSVIKKLSA